MKEKYPIITERRVRRASRRLRNPTDFPGFPTVSSPARNAAEPPGAARRPRGHPRAGRHRAGRQQGHQRALRFRVKISII
ncbi:hypothetical protein BN940_15721 [Castellaniella defragrans 65Phen]|uniref:Uncharacterized protein n=1 Tax=Castellaniella defragrans (strain DSM 12143 / CCUG 39792 / 65Phen) TaxID=1437824 RepID=W8X9X5_CASD6|nr:hypothetical protein BN940_15721 [Castellaniella defragrans 65Phen]